MAIEQGDCIALDDKDPLAFCRHRFLIPDDKIYLDGNSLGALPKAALPALDTAIQNEWGDGLIQSWNTAGWFDLPLTLGNRICELVGAAIDQIVVCDNTSINLYKAIHAGLAINSDRHRIIAHKGDFPTDLYMIEGAAKSSGRDIAIDLIEDESDIENLFNNDIAVAVLSHINYKTGALLDMETVTRKAHAAGVLVIWDLCHSAGALPVELDRCNADFAVGCSYKYLNGGPGAPAFVYAATRHHQLLQQPLSGWWSHANPFGFEPGYRATNGIKRMLSGTQPVLSLRAIGAGIDTFDGVQMQQIRQKSSALCALFIELSQQMCGDSVTVIGPTDIARRGSHVSLAHEQGFAIVQAMIARGVVGDFRAPDLMRFGFAPLYIQYQQIWEAVDVMRQCIESRVWQHPQFLKTGAVT